MGCDSPSAEIIAEGVDFIEKAHNAGRTVFVHCAKGRGRSAVLLASYYMHHHDLKFDEAVKLMKSQRTLVKQEERHRKAAEAYINQLPHHRMQISVMSPGVNNGQFPRR